MIRNPMEIRYFEQTGTSWKRICSKVFECLSTMPTTKTNLRSYTQFVFHE